MSYDGFSMDMKKGPVQGGCGRSVVLLLLTPMMTLNASQAMTLCIRSDGHVAIELVIQDRCTCEMRTSGVEADSIPTIVTSCVADGRGTSCTDLSVPIGVCGSRMAPDTSNANAVGWMTAPPLPWPATLDAINVASPESPPPLVPHHAPLDSIILRV